MDVILLMAMTVDGKIARDSSQFVDWTGKVDKKYFIATTKELGVVIMGSKTYDTIGKPLPNRHNIVMTTNVDVLHGPEPEERVLEFTNLPPKDLIKLLEERGFGGVAIIGGSVTNTAFEKEITEVHLTVVPKIFGKGLDLFCKSLNVDLDFISAKDLGSGHLLLKYIVNRG